MLLGFVVVVVLRKVQWSGDFVLGDQGLGIAKVPFWFPGVLSCRIPFPSDEEGATTRLSSVSEDRFNFIFLFAIYYVWWRLEEIRTML